MCEIAFCMLNWEATRYLHVYLYLFLKNLEPNRSGAIATIQSSEDHPIDNSVLGYGTEYVVLFDSQK